MGAKRTLHELIRSGGFPARHDNCTTPLQRTSSPARARRQQPPRCPSRHLGADKPASGGEFCFIETVNAPGKCPPQHRHREAEIVRVITGRYLYQVDGRRFFAEAGDVVSIPGGAAHGFVNASDAPARQSILITPALDAKAFFTELAETMRDGLPDRTALDAFGVRWGVALPGSPLDPLDQPAD